MIDLMGGLGEKGGGGGGVERGENGALPSGRARGEQLALGQLLL